MQSEENNTLVKLAKAVIEHAPEGGDAFWGIKFSDIEAALSAAEPQPASSVAVKALRTAIHNGLIDGARLESDLQSEFDRTVDSILASVSAALSAQVQDVAGWQDISAAPKDGSAFLAVMAKAYSPRATLCKFKDGKFLSPSQGEKFVLPGWNQWWPTHWMPLPAAPAKQEVDTSPTT